MYIRAEQRIAKGRSRSLPSIAVVVIVSRWFAYDSCSFRSHISHDGG